MPALANVFKKTVLGRLEPFSLKMQDNQKILGNLNLSRAALSQWLMQKCKSSALMYNLCVRATLKNKAKRLGLISKLHFPPFFASPFVSHLPYFFQFFQEQLPNKPHTHETLFACLLVGYQPKTFWLLTSQVVVKITQESENGYFLLGKGPSHGIFLLSFSRMRYT